MVELINIPTFSDSRGELSVIDKLHDFEIKRVYYIYNVDEGITRGGHRHHKTDQILICVKGSCEVYVNNGSEEYKFKLDNPTKGLFVSKDDWHTMSDFTDDAILLVLASTHYNLDDYIDEEYQ